MASLEQLPVELISEILKFADTRTLASLLRLSRNIHFLALPIFAARLHIDLALLLRLPFTGGDASKQSKDMERMKSPDFRLLESLEITLEGCSRVMRMLNGLPYIFTPRIKNHFLSAKNSTELVQNALSALGKALCEDATSMSRLTRLHFRASSRFQNGVVPHVGGGGDSVPCLQQHDLVEFLKAVGTCRNLRDLNVDTAEAEKTEWGPYSGIGHYCKRHTCKALASITAHLRFLRMVRWRRRDVCPLFFDAWVENAVALEILEVDMRLPAVQQTSMTAYCAHARHCNCRCWCVDCLKRYENGAAASGQSAMQSAVLGEHIPGTDLSIQPDSHFPAMIQAGIGAVVRMQGAIEVRILGYEQPQKELDNWTRRPISVDCLSRKATAVAW